MLWVRKNTHVIDHPRFLEAGALARDLWEWGMLYAGAHETDGELPMIAVLTSAWGAGGKANVKVAEKLIAVGLWERTDRGYRICRWAEQGNQTKAQIAEDREAARSRMSKRRSGNVRANTERTSADVPTSTSYSPSESGSGIRIASPSDPMPEWFGVACDAAAMAIGGEVGERPARWLEYAASRDRKGWAKNHGDAVGWLTTVVRSERAKASSRPAARGAEITKQPYDPAAPWLKLPEVG